MDQVDPEVGVATFFGMEEVAFSASLFPTCLKLLFKTWVTSGTTSLMLRPDEIILREGRFSKGSGPPVWEKSERALETKEIGPGSRR